MSTAELIAAVPAQQPVELVPAAPTDGEVIETGAAGGELAELSAIEKAVIKLFGSDARAARATNTCDQALKTLATLDLKTKKGLETATSLKTGVIKERTGAKKDADVIKKRLGDLGKAIGAEAEKIADITEPAEAQLETVIEARKDEIKAEKAEAERIDQERIAKHQQNLENLKAMLPAQEKALAAGPEKIALQIERVESVEVSPELWEEFAVPAQVEKTQILAHLRAWHDLALAHEAKARQQKLLELSGLVMGVFGKPAADIKTALERAEAVPTDAQTWGELLAQVEMTKGQTVAMLRQMLTQAEAQEQAVAQQAAAAQALAQAHTHSVEAPAAAPAEAPAPQEQPAPDTLPAEPDVVATSVEGSADAQACTGCGACTGACHDTPGADPGEPVDGAQQLTRAVVAPPPASSPEPTAPTAAEAPSSPAVAVTYAPAVTTPAPSPETPAAPAAQANSTEAAGFVKLGEFNADLAVCSVDAEQLATLGFQHQSLPGSKGKHYPKALRVAIGQALINGIQQAMARWEAEQS